MKIMTIISLLFFITSCAELLTHRTFIDQMDNDNDPLFIPGEDFNVLSGDSGTPHRTHSEIMERTPVSGLSKQQILEERSLVKELRNQELALGVHERERYYELMPYFESISEKIYYLRLSSREKMEYEDSLLPETNRVERSLASSPSYNARGGILNDYIPSDNSDFYENRGRAPAAVTPYEYIEDESSDEIFVGMTKTEVRSIWGGPNRVEVAGNPREENERWAFYHNGSVKLVYFEQGLVQGWQID